MTWFTNWFDALTALQQILACAAIPATVVLIIQTLLLLLGMGGHDGDNVEVGHDFDHDADGDTDFDHDHDHDAGDHATGLRIFTVRGLVAMFAVGGWLGIAAVDLGAGDVLAILIAIISGIASLFLVAYIIKLMLGLQEDGNLDTKNAIAHTAKVYLTIPAARKGSGKVMVTFQERLVEMEAVTDYDQDIKTDCMVQVVSATDNVLVVRPLDTVGIVE